ncbi:C40 family peptidase [Marinobacter fonticola]|uniref:C40 family peptidase n=1 Tax=Marinobacter fonticola TaxID=2603215 RepID=UPI001D0DA23D|nr:NlpC/P60 family protein [Marinobacter fonticola]
MHALTLPFSMPLAAVYRMPVRGRWLGVWLLICLTLGGCASTPGLDPYTPAPSAKPMDADSAVTAAQLWQVFERYEGVPYHYGGTSAQGFDCSGFIMTAYREAFGRQLPRTTTQLLAHGEVVPRNNVQPGDLVFFRISGKDQHAGIYMGNNRFIHASTSVGVTESALDGYYWRDRYSQARRFE